MNKTHDIFGPGSNLSERVVRDYGTIKKKVTALQMLSMKLVLTAGTFDLFHEGHSRYLEAAKTHGDVLIVGVDNDEKVRVRKGKNRPFDSEDSRMEVLCHCRHVDLVFLKKWGDPKWELIKTVRPDTLIATKETYNEEQLEALKEFCGQVVVLEPQAATSTTSKIRILLRNSLDGFREKLHDVMATLDKIAGGE